MMENEPNTSNNDHELEIVVVQSFNTDPVFESVRHIGERWLNTDIDEYSDEMDNINFQIDRIELMVDLRNYRPEDIRCVINYNTIEIKANHRDINYFNNGQEKTISTTRNYQLNRNICPDKATCFLSNDGILLISVPWA